MKLRTHYLILAFFIIVPLVAGSGLALKMLLDAHREAAVGRIEDSSRAIAMMVDAELAKALAVTHTLASSRALADNDLAAFYREAAAANAGPGAWVILYDATGQQLVNTRLPPDAVLPARRDVGTLARLVRLVRDGGSDVSGLKWGTLIGENFVTAEQGIVSRSGRHYLIAQAFSPAYFSRTFRSQILPPGWIIDLVDSGGKIIVSGTGGTGASGTVTVPAPGLHKINLRGAPVYAYTSRSDLSGWSALVGAPAGEIDVVVWRGVAAALTGMLLAALVAGTLAMRTGRRLLRFMRRAGDAAAALGQGRDIGSLHDSAIVEMEALNQALRDASVKLQEEMASRASAESERNALLVLERSARAIAEEQNAAKDEFLAMLGHELRNPLSAIAAAVALLGDGRGPADAADRARKVLQRQTAHLRALVDDLLDVNRALMGKLTLQRQRLDLAAVARECVDLRRAGGRLGRCAIRVDTQAALVDADPTRLMQIIDNILDNAVKYSPDGGTISVTVARDGPMAVLTISDTGIGIPAELLPRVFHVFVQGEQTLQRALGGLGIGLTLVRRLADMHEGSVDIDSAGAGLGTRVVLRLPLLLAAGAAEAGAVGHGADAARQGAGLKILLVEDNADAREMLAMTLEVFGHEVIQAADGPAALTAAACRPDLAFVDIGLPGMDGHAVAKALRSDPATAGIRLVALTGYGSEGSRQMALASGFDLYVTKPISLDNLRRICLG
jgi:signal transduction histidine kinase